MLQKTQEKQEDMMNYRTENLGEIKIIGIALRTYNANTENAIGKHWHRFLKDEIQQKIPNKTSNDVIALYIDYESDHTGMYTFIIGCQVRSFEDVPEGLVARTIPASRFAVFSAKGKIPEALIETWQEIWNTDLERTYTGDFDLYKDLSQQKEGDFEVSIFVAIRESAG